MIKYLLAAALLITPATAAGQDMDPGWTQIETDGYPHIYLRDQDWLKGRSHHTAVNVWTRMINAPSETRFESFLTYYQFNCVEDTYAILSSTAYLRDGRNVRLSTHGHEYTPPQTNISTMQRYVCADPI